MIDIQSFYETSRPIVLALALKVVGAIALYIVGRWLIGVVSSLVTRALERQKIEPTVIRYIGNTVSVALNVLLVIGILGYFGVETTSFAALGIAIGAASRRAPAPPSARAGRSRARPPPPRCGRRRACASRS